jgi:hypothetical protein
LRIHRPHFRGAHPREHRPIRPIPPTSAFSTQYSTSCGSTIGRQVCSHRVARER